MGKGPTNIFLIKKFGQNEEDGWKFYRILTVENLRTAPPAALQGKMVRTSPQPNSQYVEGRGTLRYAQI